MDTVVVLLVVQEVLVAVVMVLVPEKKNMPRVISCRLRITPGRHSASRPATREGAAAVVAGSSRLINTP